MNNRRSKKDMPFLPKSYGLSRRPGRRRRLPNGPIGDDGPNTYVGTGEDSTEGAARLASREGDEYSPAGPDNGEMHEEAGTSSFPAEVSTPGRDGEPGEITAEASIDGVRVNVVGVRFSRAGKIYNFDAGDIGLSVGDWVVMKTEKGVGLAQVALAPFEKEMAPHELEGLRKIIRKAGKVDFDQKVRCEKREAQARRYCVERIDALGLPMKLVGVECFFDGSKFVFYFTAEGRVDFRELVKQLVSRFPVRIEMRQIGVRHEAKMTGGLACCGQELCCSRFLTDFRPVSVKMAKAQNLSLNPTKISGVCGRLMCCLGYEHGVYEEFKKAVPRVGKCVHTAHGEAVVVKHNPLSETIQVKLEDESTMDIGRSDIVVPGDQAARKRKSGRRSDKPSGGSPEKEPVDETEFE